MCSAGQQPVFRSATLVHGMLLHLRQYALEEQFAILAYCFMPNHVHLLVEALSASADLTVLIRRWKQRTGYEHRGLAGSALWQPGYYDHVLRDHETTLTVVRYILANPVRAGLAEGIEDYPFSGSDVYSWEELAEALRLVGQG